MAKMPILRDLITETIGTGNMEEPFYVTDVDDIISKHRNWLSKMPRVKPFYAVKCNTSPVVLNLLSALGVGFDCASKAEIDAVMACGVKSSRIIYANPCKSRPFIQHAHDMGVDLMTFDNEGELDKIADVYPDARLVLRLKVDDSHAKYHLGMKFGACMNEVPDLLEKARDLDLTVVGVSFHVGSGNDSADAYKDAISNSKAVFEMATAMGFEMTLLDIGGGFPGGSDKKEKGLFDECAAVVNSTLEEYFPVEGNEHITLIAEPGRYYVTSAFTLTTKIISRRKVTTDDGEVMMSYYINDGIYGSFSNTTFEEGEVIPIPEIPEQYLQLRQVMPSVIWGQTCDSLDILHKRICIPEMMECEWMTFTDMGAYTLSLGTKFNGFGMPLIKCHASPDALTFLQTLPSWTRLTELLGIDMNRRPSKGLVYQIWDFIHVHV